MSAQLFTPFQPHYSLLQYLQRGASILQATTTVATHLVRQTSTKFAASVEITDRCNAGCRYCYVYPPEWDQQQRMKGYLQLSPAEYRSKEAQVFRTLDQLKQAGIVHVTLVGGEPSLAAKTIQYAAQRFPVVWVVTNGTGKLPPLAHSVSLFVSMDGPPDYHNHSRDPLGFFSKNQYANITGMSAAIARNINESTRGAYVHLTLTKAAIDLFPEAVHWLVAHLTKLRGIVVSGTTTSSQHDPNAFSLADRQRLKQFIAAAADQYGWKLFPFNQPTVNDFLFDENHIIQSPSQCSVAKRVMSLNFEGQSTGKCVLRDEMDCETCMCNITGLARSIDRVDFKTISGVLQATFG